MGSSKVNHEEKLDKQNETSLVGTYISVGIVAAVILLTYAVLYGLYMARV